MSDSTKPTGRSEPPIFRVTKPVQIHKPSSLPSECCSVGLPGCGGQALPKACTSHSGVEHPLLGLLWLNHQNSSFILILPLFFFSSRITKPENIQSCFIFSKVTLRIHTDVTKQRKKSKALTKEKTQKNQKQKQKKPQL